MGRMTMGDVKHRHAMAGGHFFDPATMRFFRSRVESTHADGGFFVTSEQFVPYDGDPHPREYRVRWFDADNPVNIDAVGDWYADRADAMAAMREAARGEGGN